MCRLNPLISLSNLLCKTLWMKFSLFYWAQDDTFNQQVKMVHDHKVIWYEWGKRLIVMCHRTPDTVAQLSLGRISVAPRHYELHNLLINSRTTTISCTAPEGLRTQSLAILHRLSCQQGLVIRRNFGFKTVNMCWLWFVHAFEIVTSEAKPGMLDRAEETENWALRSEAIISRTGAS